MSWANELVPLRITLRSIWEDLRASWKLYKLANVPISDRAAFLALRVLQRVAYNAGWKAGIRTVHDPPT